MSQKITEKKASLKERRGRKRRSASEIVEKVKKEISEKIRLPLRIRFMLYDPKDFEKYPLKYKEFRTAVIAKDIPSSPHLKVGDVVSIAFNGLARNDAFGGVVMPVYSVRTPQRKEEESLLYACALKDFVL